MVRLVFLVNLELDLVEAGAIYTVYIGLCDECVGVDALDYAEYCPRFDFTADDQQHLDLVACVPSHAGENGAPAVSLIVDCRGDMLPVGREDGELNRLTVDRKSVV